MKEVQEILHLIVNDLERTAAGLVVLSQEMYAGRGGKSFASALDAMALAKQGNAASYKGIRARIDALAASSLPSGSGNRQA